MSAARHDAFDPATVVKALRRRAASIRWGSDARAAEIAAALERLAAEIAGPEKKVEPR